MTLFKRKDRPTYYGKAQVNGETIRQSSGTGNKAEATAWYKEEFLPYIHSLRNAPGVSRTLAQAIVHEVDHIARTVSEQQAERIGNSLKAFAAYAGGETFIRTIDTTLIASYLYDRSKKNMALSTLQKDRCYLMRMLRHNGFDVEAPPLPQAKERTIRAFTPDEIKRFFEHLADQHRPLFLMMTCTGARVSELVPSKHSNHTALLKSEIDQDNGTVILRSSKRRKGKRTRRRIIHIDPELAQIVLDAAPIGEYCFEPQPQSVSTIVDRTLRKAGIPKWNALDEGLNPSSFRHYFATQAHARLGGDLLSVSRLLGHTNVRTTTRYDEAKTTAQVLSVADLVPTLGAQEKKTTSLEAV